MAAVPPLLALISMAKPSDNGREKSVSQKLSTAEASSKLSFTGRLHTTHVGAVGFKFVF